LDGLGLRPEHELLLCVARTRGAGAHAARARELASGRIDWAFLLVAALDHGVMPLLYRNFDILGPGAAPDRFAHDLGALYLANRYRNLALTAELARVLGLFEASGLPAAAYGGPVLAALAYGDTALRQASPLAVLVNREDLDWATALVLGAGYLPRGASTPHRARHEEAHSGVRAFALPDPEAELGVRWRFAPDFLPGGPDPRAALENRRRERLGERMVPTLDPDDALLALVLAGALNCWKSLALLCDLAELLSSRDDWEWTGLLGRAREEGSLRMLLLGVSLAARLLAAPIPREVLERADRKRDVAELRRRAAAALFAAREARLPQLATPAFQARALDTGKARIACWRKRAAVPTRADWEWLDLPDALFPLYWAVRPLRLAFRGALALRPRRPPREA
jgi:hypothetical protein